MCHGMNATSNRLTRDTVLGAALELLNEVGIDALSTRRLAERLGVQSPTLYWHFKNKAALLEAMSEAIMLRHHDAPPPLPGGDWRSWFLANALGFRRALLAYRDGARLHAGTRPRTAHFDAIEAKVRLLCENGFAPDEAVHLMFVTGRLVVGWVLEEQSAAQPDAPPSAQGEVPSMERYPLSARGWLGMASQEQDAAFERAVRLLMDGAEAARAARAG